eukprot:m.144329 g.144329  ORF g.144329 m.144329 type:complete len:554 (-) comp20462_c0_seq1:147-1808(-)
MQLPTDVIKSASTATATIVLLNLVGAVASNFPKSLDGGEHGLIKRPLIRSLSLLATTLFIPCLSGSTLGANLSPSLIRDSYPLLLWSVFNVVLGFSMSYLLAKVMRVSSEFVADFRAACTFQNIVALPLIMSEVLCSQSQLEAEENCTSRASTFVFLYMFGWSITFWSFGVYVVRGEAANYGPDGQKLSTLQRLQSMARNMFNPPLLGTLTGIAIATIPGVQDVFFGNDPPLAFVSSAAVTLGRPVVTLTTLISAASLGKTIPVHAFLERLQRRWDAWRHHRRLSKARALHWGNELPPVTFELSEATLDSVAGVSPPSAAHHQEVEVKDDDGRDSATASEDDTELPDAAGATAASQAGAPVTAASETTPATFSVTATAAVAAAATIAATTATSSTCGPPDSPSGDLAGPTMSAAANDCSVPSTKTSSSALVPAAGPAAGPAAAAAAAGPAAFQPTTRDMLTLVLGRVVVVAGTQFTLGLLLAPYFFSGPDEKLMRLVLALECITPTANMIIIVCQREGRSGQAEVLARGLVYMYFVCIVTMVVFISIALNTLY